MPLNSKAIFLSAFKKSGSVSLAAKVTGVDRAMHYRNLRNDPSYKKAFDQLCVKMITHKSKRAVDQIPGLEERLREEIRLMNDRFRDVLKNHTRRLRDLEAKLEGRTTETRAHRPRPTETDALLDQIAQGMAKKPFKKLNQTHQEAVRSIAERLREPPD